MATKNYNLPYPSLTNVANIPSDIQKLAESVDEVLSEEIKKQNEKNTAQDKEIESLYNIAPKEKLQGTSFHIPDSAEAPMKISPRGNIEQEGEPSLNNPVPVKHVGGKIKSYNELPVTINSTALNDVTATINEDKSITVNGTATANTIIALNEGVTYSAGTYKLSGCPNGGATDTYRLDLMNALDNNISNNRIDTGNSTTFILEEETTLIARIRIQTGTTLNNLVFKPMLVKGTEEKPYLPYGEVGSVYDNYISDNFFDNVFRQGGYNNAAVNMAKRVFSQNQFTVKAGQEYTVLTNLDLSIYQYVIGLSQTEFPVNTLVSDSGWISSNEYKFTPNSDTYFGIGIRRKDEGAITPSDFENVWFLVVTKYQQLSLDLTNLPLYSENDYIYKSGDKWFVHNEYVKDILDGVTKLFISKSSTTANIMIVTNAFNQDILPAPNHNTIVKHYSNYFKGDVSTNTIYSSDVKGSSIRQDKTFAIGFGLDSEITTVEEANAWLQEKYNEGNPMYVISPLATPTETEITDETVIAQLEELYNTYAYDEVTNITVDNPILSAPLVLDIEYYIKTALGLETKVSYEEYAKLLKRVEELEAQIGG